MADKEISSLPAATSITDADLFVLQQSGTAKSLTGAILSQYAHNIESASINAQGHLILTLKGGETVDAGTLPAGPGTGDMLASIYDAAQGRKQVAFKDDTDAAIAAEAAAREAKDTAQDGSIATLTSRSNNMVNPNLLDNWYFGNPVNQRGQTSYSGGLSYCVDRWKVQADTNVALANDGIILSGSWDLRQFVENMPAGTCTFSVLYKDAVLGTTFKAAYFTASGDFAYEATTTNTAGLLTITAKPGDVSGVVFGFSGGSNSSTILAVKLELGDTQTLAHQDASGNWVLNEIPDYGEQLRRCQRYFIKAKLRAARSCALTSDEIVFSPLASITQPMRALPVAKISNIQEYTAGSPKTLKQMFQTYTDLYPGFSIGSCEDNVVQCDIELSADL